MNRVLNWLSLVVLLLALGLILYASYLAFYPFKTNYSYLGDVLPVVNKQVKAGELVTYKSDVEQYTQGITVDRIIQIVNGHIINLPNVSYVTRKGRMTFDQSVRIPLDTVPGIYHLEFSSTFNFSPIRKITISRRTVDFEVIK